MGKSTFTAPSFKLKELQASEAQLQASARDYLLSIGAVDLTQIKPTKQEIQQGKRLSRYAEKMAIASNSTRGPIAWFVRNNVGWGRVGGKDGRLMPFGVVGSGDFILKWRDRPGNIYVEFKVGDNKLSEVQKAFQRLALATCDDYMVCRDVSDLITRLHSNQAMFLE